MKFELQQLAIFYSFSLSFAGDKKHQEKRSFFCPFKSFKPKNGSLPTVLWGSFPLWDVG
jgi:hypothetical protein